MRLQHDAPSQVIYWLNKLLQISTRAQSALYDLQSSPPKVMCTAETVWLAQDGGGTIGVKDQEALKGAVGDQHWIQTCWSVTEMITQSWKDVK